MSVAILSMSSFGTLFLHSNVLPVKSLKDIFVVQELNFVLQE